MIKTSRYVVLTLIVLSLVMLYADQNLIAPMLLVLRDEGLLPHENELFYYYAGLLGTVPVLSGIATTLIWGYLADKLSRRTLFATAVLVGEIPCFLTAFARSYHEMLLLRAFTGVGINGAAPVARALVADLYPPEKRGTGYALYNFSTGIGVLLGMLIAGVALSAGLSWRVPFMVAAAPNFLLIPLFLLLVKEVKVGYAEPELKKLYDAGQEYRYRIRLREFFVALATTPTIIFIYLQGVPGTFPWGALPYWSVAYFQRAWGLGEFTATLIVMFAGFGMMIGYFVGGVLTDYLLRKGFVNGRLLIPFIGILAGTATTVALITYPYPYGQESPAVLAPVLLVALLGMVFVTFAAPNVPAVISEVTLPEHRGTVFGMFQITDNVGAALGPIIAGAIMAYLLTLGFTEPSNMKYGLIIMSMFWIPCALLWLPAFRTYRKDRSKLRTILSSRVAD